MQGTFVDNIVDAAADFFLVLISAFLSPILFILDLLNIVNFDVSLGGSA